MADYIGKYELRSVLGKGAEGTVYEGFDRILARQVAIKTIKIPAEDDVESQDELARFRREAQAAGRLHHANVQGILDYGQTQEIAYIVMEYVDGTSLKHFTDLREIFDLNRIVSIVRSILSGLQYCHERGVIHRDIKPGNIILDQSGQVKITDFGIARIENSSLTQRGTMLGTPSYMSPEQFMGTEVDGRTDIYSTGVLLYQLLCGEKPFEGGLTAIMHNVLNNLPRSPSSIRSGVPLVFDQIVKIAMSKQPTDRFESALIFSKALSYALENRDISEFLPKKRIADPFEDLMPHKGNEDETIRILRSVRQTPKAIVFGGEHHGLISLIDPPGGLICNSDQREGYSSVREKAEELIELCGSKNRLVDVKSSASKLLLAAGTSMEEIKVRAFWSQMNSLRRRVEADIISQGEDDPEDPPLPPVCSSKLRDLVETLNIFAAFEPKLVALDELKIDPSLREESRSTMLAATKVVESASRTRQVFEEEVAVSLLDAKAQSTGGSAAADRARQFFVNSARNLSLEVVRRAYDGLLEGEKPSERAEDQKRADTAPKSDLVYLQTKFVKANEVSLRGLLSSFVHANTIQRVIDFIVKSVSGGNYGKV